MSAASPETITSKFVDAGAELNTDPSSALWSAARPVTAARGRFGEKIPGRATEVRSRWSPTHLYLFFICPYDRLHLKPNPSVTTETDHLWDWDVAEAFIGTDPKNIRHYTEYELSPQGEWVDLDIERSNPKSPGIRWNSGFEVKAHIDATAKIWYGAMKIPMQALNVKPVNGGRVRINFYRCQGPPPSRTYITWRPTNSETFHVAESFGSLEFQGAPALHHSK